MIWTRSLAHHMNLPYRTPKWASRNTSTTWIISTENENFHGIYSYTTFDKYFWHNCTWTSFFPKAVAALFNTNFVFNSIQLYREIQLVWGEQNMSWTSVSTWGSEESSPFLAEDFLYTNTNNDYIMEMIFFHWNNCLKRTPAVHKTPMAQETFILRWHVSPPLQK